jgi:quercetin 2,3-dioxygenase
MQRRTFFQSLALPLLFREPASPGAPRVVRVGADRFGEDIRIGGVSPNHCKLSSVDTGGALSVFESSTVGRGGPSYHLHHGQDEWFFVREGEFLFRVDGADHRLGPGDSIFAPRGIPHTWAHLGDGVGRMVFLLNPAGLMESYFREIGRPGVRRTPEESRRLSEAHGMTRLGPGIAVDR